MCQTGPTKTTTTAELRHWSWEVNLNGDTEGDIDPFNLPAGIVRLERLEVLVAIKCRFIPVDLCNLPHLKYVPELYSMFISRKNLPVGMELQQVESLGFSECQCHRSSAFFTMISGFVPSLIALLLSFVEEDDEINFILGAHGTTDLRFRENLKSLEISYCKLNDSQL